MGACRLFKRRTGGYLFVDANCIELKHGFASRFSLSHLEQRYGPRTVNRFVPNEAVSNEAQQHSPYDLTI